MKLAYCGRRLTAAAVLASAACAVLAQAPDWSLQARQHLIASAGADFSQLMAERRGLLDAAEQALATGNAVAAQDALDRASLMLHAPDTEAGLVRAQLQAGAYRQALAFGAHAAGAHRREWPAGTALYVWLLHAGGQSGVAQRLLNEALAEAPGDKDLLAVRFALTQAGPLASGVLDQPPIKLAPYAWGEAAPAGTRVVGSGMLVANGQAALVPVSILPVAPLGASPQARLWLRNGLGQTVSAYETARDETLGVALLRLAAALTPPDWTTAPREPFAGSPGSLVEFSADDAGAAAWPLLRQGFFARMPGPPGLRALGIAAASGPRGGPVIDLAGHWVGLAIRDEAGIDRLVGSDDLTRRFGLLLPATPGLTAATATPTGTTATSFPRAEIDAVYEQSLRGALQLLLQP